MFRLHFVDGLDEHSPSGFQKALLKGLFVATGSRDRHAPDGSSHNCFFSDRAGLNRAGSIRVWNLAYGTRCVGSGSGDRANAERKSDVLRLIVGQPRGIGGGSAWSAVSAGCNLSGHTHKVAFLRCLPRIRFSMFRRVRCEMPYRVNEFALLQALVGIT